MTLFFLYIKNTIKEFKIFFVNLFLIKKHNNNNNNNLMEKNINAELKSIMTPTEIKKYFREITKSNLKLEI